MDLETNAQFVFASSQAIASLAICSAMSHHRLVGLHRLVVIYAAYLSIQKCICIAALTGLQYKLSDKLWHLNAGNLLPAHGHGPETSVAMTPGGMQLS